MGHGCSESLGSDLPERGTNKSSGLHVMAAPVNAAFMIATGTAADPRPLGLRSAPAGQLCPRGAPARTLETAE